MKVTRLGPPIPVLNSGLGGNAGSRIPGGGDDLKVLTSNGSNGRYWGENVRRITSNGSNTLLQPDVNFQGGSGVIFSVSSNTLTISSSTTGLSFSSGSNSNQITPLDDISLHPTYGDHYTGPLLDGKWTRKLRAAYSEQFGVPSWMSVLPFSSTNYGDLQAFTDTAEFEIQMAASYYSGITDEGFGPCVLDSADTGLWLGHRLTSRLGLFVVTTGTTATEPVAAANLGYAGATYLGAGRKAWYSIIKKKCGGVDIYWFRVSFDGATWTRYLVGYDPTDFTPAKVGWLQGVQNAATLSRAIGIDWFNVKDAFGIGNDLMTTPSSGTVTASSDAASQTGAASLVIDGNLTNEWFFPNTNAAGVHWQAAFSVAQPMNRLRILTRGDTWGIARVTVNSVDVGSLNLPTTGWSFIDFPTVSATQVRIYWQKQGHGTNPGLREVEAYLAS